MGAGLAWYSREETTWKAFQASLLETPPGQTGVEYIARVVSTVKILSRHPGGFMIFIISAGLPPPVVESNL